MKNMKIFDNEAETFSYRLNSEQDDNLFLELHNSRLGSEIYGLSGGEARDFFVGYDGLKGDAGLDLFLPEVEARTINDIRRNYTERFHENSDVLIVVDNLGENYCGISLAGHSYFDTVTAGISKVLVLYFSLEKSYYVMGHSKAKDDKSRKKISLDWGKHGFTHMENLIDWRTLAKLSNLAITYGPIGYSLDDITEEILEKLTAELSEEDSRKSAIHIAYKLHPSQFSNLEIFLEENSWAKHIFDNSSGNVFEEAWKVLKKYNTKERVILQRKDRPFD